MKIEVGGNVVGVVFILTIGLVFMVSRLCAILEQVIPLICTG